MLGKAGAETQGRREHADRALRRLTLQGFGLVDADRFLQHMVTAVLRSADCRARSRTCQVVVPGRSQALDTVLKVRPCRSQALETVLKPRPGRSQALDQVLKARPGRSQVLDPVRKALPGRSQALDPVLNVHPHRDGLGCLCLLKARYLGIASACHQGASVGSALS